MTQYQRGDYREKAAKEFLEVRGWMVWQSRGSHGFADLIALYAGHAPLLIQVKSGNAALTHYEWNGLLRAAQIAGAIPLYVYVTRRGVDWAWRQITDLHRVYSRAWPSVPYGFPERLDKFERGIE